MEIIRFLNEWFWQFPQTLSGSILKFLLKERILKTVIIWENYFNKEVHLIKGFNKGFSLGKHVFIDLNYNPITTQHELGHSKQSQILGPLYLIIIGLPSLIHAYLYKGLPKDYYNFYTEKWANKLMGIKIASS